MEMTPQNHEEHHKSHALKWLLTGTALAAGAVILSPYVLPLVGIGSSAAATDAMVAIHSASGGTGLAGMINNAMGTIPVVGEALAEGGVATAAASGLFGVAGVLLNRYSQKGDDGKHHIRWGKVIGTAALITSALIALPTVLTGISAGVVFLGSLAGVEVGEKAVSLMASTLGAANAKNLTITGVSAASIALPHLLTCGAVALPAAISFGLNHKQGESPGQETQQPTQPAIPVMAAAPNASTHHMHDPNDHSVAASIRLEKPTTANEETRGVLILKHADSGKPISRNELQESNEAIIHFFINNSSLTDYHHIHPVATDTPGEYAFSFKANTSQPYKGWATLNTLPDEKHHQVSAAMPAAVNRNVPPHVRMNSQVDLDGLSFDWKSDKPLQKGVPANIEVTIKDASGKPVSDLQPVYGEWCHLEGFSNDFKTMIHTHPTGREPAGKDDRMGSPLRFTITPEVEGATQFYVQVKRGDKDIYAPIGQYVKGPEKATERVSPRTPMSMPSAQQAYQRMG